jgi:hypothetical protein
MAERKKGKLTRAEIDRALEKAGVTLPPQKTPEEIAADRESAVREAEQLLGHLTINPVHFAAAKPTLRELITRFGIEGARASFNKPIQVAGRAGRFECIEARGVITGKRVKRVPRARLPEIGALPPDVATFLEISRVLHGSLQDRIIALALAYHAHMVVLKSDVINTSGGSYRAFEAVMGEYQVAKRRYNETIELAHRLR